HAFSRNSPQTADCLVAEAVVFEPVSGARFTENREKYREFDQINDRLREIDAKGEAPYEINRFRAGDQYSKNEPFPVSVSLETVRNALTVAGMRKKRGHRTRS